MADELMGRNEYARHRGVTPNAVAKAEEDGRIAAAVKRGSEPERAFIGIDWRLADELWAKATDPAQALRSGTVLAAPGGNAPSANESAPAEEKKDEPAAQAAATPKDHGYYEARATREKYQAKQAELDYLQAIGKLVPADELREASTRRYRAMRDKLLSIPDRVAAILAAEKDPARVHAALQAEIKAVLHELSDDARAEIARGVAERLAA